MNKERLENLLNIMVSSGSDYSDIFLEEKFEKVIKVLDSRVDDVIYEKIKGAGLRVCDEHKTYYSAINNYDYDSCLNAVNELSSNIKKDRIIGNVILNELEDNNEVSFNKNLTDKEKKEYLLNIDRIARLYDSKITQVNAQFLESEQEVYIATSEGKYVKDKRFLKRLIIIVFASNGEKLTQSGYSMGSSSDYSFLDNVNIFEDIKELCKVTIAKLDADYAPSGRMPVIIGNDSGVLIHEACGHALEATSVADNASILSNSLNKKVASAIVTVIDDGTIPNFFGTTKYDDEGEKTKRNVLIENGILKSYLVDKKNAKRMNHYVTGSSRRESYKLAPTSRMNNTFLDKGTSIVSDMIKSIDFGLYAKKLGGGEVYVTTGDFNFGVDEAYIIRNGQVCEMVTGASLIGNTKEILNNIEMVSNDLNYGTGLCGASSGLIPVTDGQPTVKLSSILVGGKK